MKVRLSLALCLLATACAGQPETIIPPPTSVALPPTETTVAGPGIPVPMQAAVPGGQGGTRLPSAEGEEGEIQRVAREALRVLSEGDIPGLAEIIPPVTLAECGEMLEDGPVAGDADLTVSGEIDVEIIGENFALASVPTLEAGVFELGFAKADGTWYYGLDCDLVAAFVQATYDWLAQERIRWGLATALAHYTVGRTFEGLLEAAATIKPDLALAELDGATVGVVGVSADTTGVFLVTASETGRWFCAVDTVDIGMMFGQGDTFEEVGTIAGCRATGDPNGWF